MKRDPRSILGKPRHFAGEPRSQRIEEAICDGGASNRGRGQTRREKPTRACVKARDVRLVSLGRRPGRGRVVVWRFSRTQSCLFWLFVAAEGVEVP